MSEDSDYCEECGEGVDHTKNSIECFILQEWKKDRALLSALKAELKAEVQRLKDYLDPTVAELVTVREERDALKAGLRAIASDRWCMGECQIEEFKGMDEKSIARKVLGNCPPHSWDSSGERCTKCGDKDWMT